MALFNGRVIAITGAASGIGLATAHLLASQGATLSIADVNAGALDNTERDLRAKYPSAGILSYVVDVRNEEQVAKWIETTIDVFGRLDGAANLAGVIGTPRALPDPLPHHPYIRPSRLCGQVTA